MGIANLVTGFGFIEWLIVGFIAANTLLCGAYALHRIMRRTQTRLSGE